MEIVVEEEKEEEVEEEKETGEEQETLEIRKSKRLARGKAKVVYPKIQRRRRT